MRARHLSVFLFIGNYTLIDSATGFYTDLHRAVVIPNDWKLIVLQLIFDFNFWANWKSSFTTRKSTLGCR